MAGETAAAAAAAGSSSGGMTAAQAGLIGSGISGTASVGNTIFGMVSANHENKRQRAFAERMAEKSRQWQIEQWNMENQYNSPAAQMQRFVDAGLNPNLIYGQLGNGLNSAPSVPQADSPQNHVGRGMLDFGLQDYMQGRLIDAQIQRLETQNSNDSKITDAQIDDIYGNTPYKREVIDNLKASSSFLNERTKEVSEMIKLHQADLNLKYLDYSIREVILEKEKVQLEWLPDVLRATVGELDSRAKLNLSNVDLNEKQKKVCDALVNYYNSQGDLAAANTALINLQKTLTEEYGEDLMVADILDKSNRVFTDSYGMSVGPVSVNRSQSYSRSLSNTPFDSKDVLRHEYSPDNSREYVTLKDGSFYYKSRNGDWKFVNRKKLNKYKDRQ